MDVVLSIAAQLELADSLGLRYALIWRPASGRLELVLARPGQPDRDPSLHVVGPVALYEIAGNRSGLRRLAFGVDAYEPAVDQLPRLLAEARTFVRSRRSQIAQRALALRRRLVALGLAPAPAPAAA